MFSDVRMLRHLLSVNTPQSRPDFYKLIYLIPPLVLFSKRKKPFFGIGHVRDRAGVLLAHHPYFVDNFNTSVTDIPSLIDKHFLST